MSGRRSGWTAKIAEAAIVLLLVAAGARLAWELLQPFIPWLVLLITLIGVFAILFGGFRRY